LPLPSSTEPPSRCSIFLAATRSRIVALRRRPRPVDSAAPPLDFSPEEAIGAATSLAAMVRTRLIGAGLEGVGGPGRGAWGGSTADEATIAWLRQTNRVPSATQVELRVPGDEVVLEPRDGKVVIFGSQFERGFGLPAKAFFRSFLDFFDCSRTILARMQ
jgi:hypothetical protein